VIERIGKDDAVGDVAPQRRERRFVGDIARCEEQGGFLAVKLREFLLEQYVIVRGAGDVARAAGASADPVERLMHRRQHHGMLAHPEVVVRAPYGYRRPQLVMERARKRTRSPLQVGEVAIAPLRPQRLQSRFEEGLAVVRCRPLRSLDDAAFRRAAGSPHDAVPDHTTLRR
jgi:hypothetical protein